MLRRPSHFVSTLVLQQDYTKGKGDATISSQDEISRSRKQKSSLKGFEPSVSETTKSIDLEETKKLTASEQIKKDILNYLDNLIEKTEWLAILCPSFNSEFFSSVLTA